jgi:hypothetical protein
LKKSEKISPETKERAEFISHKYPDFPKELISDFIDLNSTLEENIKLVEEAYWLYM